ncbi:MAG: YceD family protein [Bacillota bacterium]|jgi:uncharacterized protein
MHIDVSQIKKHPAVHELQLVEKLEPFNWQGEGLSFKEPVLVSLKLERIEEGFFVRGMLKTVLSSRCSRCLMPVNYPVQGEFEGEFILGSQAAPDQEEEDFPGQFFTGDVLDLKGLIYETIYLHLPMQFLCSPKCRGLCPHCGNNLNFRNCSCQEEQVDPRLEVLKDLLRK